MNISRVFKYLISGIIVGAVLFFAGFGVVNMLNKPDQVVQSPVSPEGSVDQSIAVPESATDNATTSDTVVSNDATTASGTQVEVTPPTIEVNSTNPQAQNGDGTAASPIKIKPIGSDETDDVEVQSIEKTAAFGTLTLSTVNSQNGQPTSADFMIENSDGVAIALVKDTDSSTLSLPAGDYKITVTQGQAKLVRFLGVKEGLNGAEVFELDVPVLADEAASEQSAPQGADTPVTVEQAASTDTPVTESDPAQQAEASEATTQASAEQTAQAETTEEMATDDPQADGVDRPATEAETAVTVAPSGGGSSTAMGGLRLSALTKVGNRPTNASFYIQKLNGENVENVQGVSTQQFNLPAGKYRITARKGTARVVAEITVEANRGLHKIFHIPEVPASASAASANSASAAATANSAAQTPRPASSASSQSTPARPAAVTAPTPPATAATPAATPTRPAQPASTTASADTDKGTGRLELFSQSVTNNVAIKSNFYVQTTAGKLVTNKTYVDSIGYKLPVGKYKVTVRSTGYNDKTIELFVREGQVRREVFRLQPKNSAPAPTPAPAPAPTSQAPATIPMIPAPAPGTPPAVAQQPAPAPAAQNRQARRGGLQVNIVSAANGQGLIADISVHRPNGVEIRRSNQTTTARFDLPPREFILRVNYGGLITNQKVRIRTGQLAIKTITFR